MATGNYLFSGTSPSAPGNALLTLTGSGESLGGTNANIATRMDQWETMSVTATLVGATGGTLDVYIQFCPDGNGTNAAGNWYDLAHYPQLAAGGGAVTTVWNTCRWNQQGTPIVTGDATSAPNTFIQGEWGDRLRVKVVAGASTSAGAVLAIRIVCNRVYSKN